MYIFYFGKSDFLLWHLYYLWISELKNLNFNAPTVLIYVIELEWQKLSNLLIALPVLHYPGTSL